MHNTVNDFSPEELGQLALHEYALRGPNDLGLRLVFTALEKDPYQPKALLALGQLLNAFREEQEAAIILEYALAIESPIPIEEQNELENLRMRFKWQWGFAKHKHGKQVLSGVDFNNQNSFFIDEMRYWTFFSPLQNKAGSLELAFQTIRQQNGKEIGFLRKGPNGFSHTPAWESWLNQPPEHLEVISQEYNFRENELSAQKEAKRLAQKELLAKQAYHAEFRGLMFLSWLNILGAFLSIIASELDFTSWTYKFYLVAAVIYFVISVFVRKGIAIFYPFAIILMVLQGIGLLMHAALSMSEFFFWIISIFVGAIWLDRFYNLDLFSFKRQVKLDYHEKSWFGVGCVLFGVVFLTALVIRYS